MAKVTLRSTVQAIWTLASNSYLVGLIQGKIYKGNLKRICVPGLNCYSCPGALGSCPIGSLQAVVGSWKFQTSLYITGFLMLIGAICGRFVCGWLCPFGWIQDLLYKIPFVRKLKTFKLDKPLRFLKYVILLLFVIILPMFIVDVIGQGMPFFCKLICPSGTLMGGWPLILSNKPLQDTIGWLFIWKNVVLVAIIILSIIIYRPFCKYICPLGAIYSLFNPISFYKLRVAESRCTKCGICSKTCGMNIDPYKQPNHPECIRCNACKKACPTNAISVGCLSEKKEMLELKLQAKKQ
ncbi:4Fe-4S binding protein [Anaerocolumna sp. MB42-C2]|uniref:4Fe-4S binding protein n=1 Tax=Anaerocolumna sp. MB42-C2 TaxID=3070997 RepID=UPI0027DEEC1A|nr:4Fe-4S binding protein [Anaerocolumna sp. MB42-C2]WMJ90520.1 4Fe-4S binding protein [Anaerocolumna sp. MB42-C2]